MAKTELFSEWLQGHLVIADQGQSTGKRFWVHSGTGTDSSGWGSAPDTPVATLDYAIGLCTDDKNDIIYVMPGHAETWTTTGAKVVADIKGVRIIGLGQGVDRPTFTFSHTGTTWTISAGGVTIENLLLVTGVDSVTTFATVSGADFTIRNCEFRDTTDIEVITALTVTGSRLQVIDCLHLGYTGGDANARSISLNGIDGALIRGCRFLGKATTAVVNMITAACSRVLVDRCDFLVTATTDLSKSVVATIGGSTWEVRDCFDLAAGCSFSGGSGAALAKDDVSTIITAIGTLVNTGGTATLGGILGDVANTSIASNLAKIGTLLNTGGTSTLGGILGDVANTSVATRLATPQTGTAQAGAAGTITLAAAASATNNLYNGCTVQIVSGTGAGEVGLITAYNGGTKVATVLPNWATTPDNTSVYILRPVGVTQVQELAAAALTSVENEVLDSLLSAHATTRTIGAVLQVSDSGTAQGGAAGTITLAASASASSGVYIDCTVQIIGGTGVGQIALVTAYDGGTKIATIAPNWAVPPDGTSVYLVRPVGVVDVQSLGAPALATIENEVLDSALSAHVTSLTLGAAMQVPQAGTAQAGGATSITLAAAASATNELYDRCIVQIIGGTGAGQIALITAYNGGTKVATTAPGWATQPDVTSIYVVRPVGIADVQTLAANVITATAINADAITNAKIADNALASEQFALSAGEKTTDGIVVTRAAAALPQTAAAPIFTVTGLCRVKRIVGYVTAQIGAVLNNTKLVGNSTGAGASTDLCGVLDVTGDVVDSRYEITGNFVNAMVQTIDIPAGPVQAADIVIPPGTIDLDCAGSDGSGGRVRWSITYVPMEASAQIVAA